MEKQNTQTIILEKKFVTVIVEEDSELLIIKISVKDPSSEYYGLKFTILITEELRKDNLS